MTEFDPALVKIHRQERLEKIKALLKACTAQNIKIVTAESITGGGIAHALTELAGSSNMLSGGFVVYNDSEKTEAFAINPQILAEHTAVSAVVAKLMAKGALTRSATATVAVSVTGYADESEQGGTVFIGGCYKVKGKYFDIEPEKHQFSTNRRECREQTTDAAINLLARIVEIIKGYQHEQSR